MSTGRRGRPAHNRRKEDWNRDDRETMYMAMDQFGHCHHGLKAPRKELAELYGVTTHSLGKMYQDRDGKQWHIGYIVKSQQSISPGFEHWFTIYEVKRWEKLA